MDNTSGARTHVDARVHASAGTRSVKSQLLASQGRRGLVDDATAGIRMNPRDRIYGPRRLENGHLGRRREASDRIEEEAGDIWGYAGYRAGALV